MMITEDVMSIGEGKDIGAALPFGRKFGPGLLVILAAP